MGRRDLFTFLALIPMAFVIVALKDAGDWGPWTLFIASTIGMLIVGGIGFHTDWPHRRRRGRAPHRTTASH